MIEQLQGHSRPDAHGETGEGVKIEVREEGEEGIDGGRQDEIEEEEEYVETDDQVVVPWGQAVAVMGSDGVKEEEEGVYSEDEEPTGKLLIVSIPDEQSFIRPLSSIDQNPVPPLLQMP